MTTELEQIKPETLAIIEKQAKTFGLSADEYLRSLLPQNEQNLALKSGVDNDEFEADMITFTEGTENISHTNGAYSREDIYFDHD
jgi:hypothetical protein